MENHLKRNHSPRPRLPTPWSLYDVLKLSFLAVGVPKNGFVSVDVTDRCNLKCEHCYFLEQSCAGEGDLPIEGWIARFEELKARYPRQFPFLQCTWVGGEPLLRKDLIERCKGYFRYNTVVTNGSIPLPPWHDVHFYVSVDGTEEHHDALRNKKGLYRRIMRNANRPELDITIACCITRENWESIEQLVHDWNEVEGVGHMVFDFYTPVETIDRSLWLGWELRDHMIDTLLALKRVYGDFIITPPRVFRLMRSENAGRVTRSCLFAEKSTAFGPKGEIKEKCMLGPKADCERCGCVVPYYLHSLVDRSFLVRDTIRQLPGKRGRATLG